MWEGLRSPGGTTAPPHTLGIVAFFIAARCNIHHRIATPQNADYKPSFLSSAANRYQHGFRAVAIFIGALLTTESQNSASKENPPSNCPSCTKMAAVNRRNRATLKLGTAIAFSKSAKWLAKRPGNL
jgi:hypothetical protein